MTTEPGIGRSLPMRILQTSLLMVLGLSLLACAGVAPAGKPLTAERPRDEALRTDLHRELSSLNIVVAATAAELGDSLNRLVPRELYKGGTKAKGINAEILRNGAIGVTIADNYLHLSVPVTLSLSYSIFTTPAIATRLQFRLRPTVTPDWRIETEIFFTGLSDQLVEEVGIGPFSFKPRSAVDGASQPLQRTLSVLVSRKLNEKFPLKAQVAKAWAAAQQPVALDRSRSAWLQVTPREALLYPLYLQNNQLKLSVGLTSLTELVVGPQPPPRAPLPLPNLKLVNSTERVFRIALHGDLFYSDLLKIAAPLLLNREFGSDGKSLVLKDLQLYGNGDRLVIRAVTAGSLDGVVYLTCRPLFDPQTNLFAVADVEFDLQTQSLLLQSADWLLHSSIRSEIQEKLNMNLTQRLLQARELAGAAMTRVKLADSVFLTGNVKALRPGDVLVQRDKISLLLYAEGEAALVFH